MKRICNTKRRIVDVIVFYREKNIQLQLVNPPTMPLEALMIPDNQLIVTPMALTEEQVVMLYFFLFHSPGHTLDIFCSNLAVLVNTV